MRPRRRTDTGLNRGVIALHLILTTQTPCLLHISDLKRIVYLKVLCSWSASGVVCDVRV